MEDLLRDAEIIQYYEQYVASTKEQNIPIDSLSSIIEKVANGDRGFFSIRDSVLAVLKAMAYYSNKTLAEIEEDANEGYEERMALLRQRLDPNTYATIEQNMRRMKTLSLENNLEPDLSQEFFLKKYELELRQHIPGATIPDGYQRLSPMSGDDIVDLILNLIRQNQTKNKAVSNLLKNAGT